MTEQELERLEELEKAATPGPWLPWIEHDPEFGTHIGMVDDADSPNTIFHPSNTDFKDDTSSANVKLMAALRNAAPALIAAARENASMQVLVDEYRMRLAGCLVVAEGGSVPTDALAYVRNCPTVQAVQRLAAENARLRAVVEAARAVPDRWTFHDQQHAHSWHDWADVVPALVEALSALDATDADPVLAKMIGGGE